MAQTLEDLRTLLATDAKRHVETGPDYDRAFFTLASDALWIGKRPGREQEAQYWVDLAFERFWVLHAEHAKRHYDRACSCGA